VEHVATEVVETRDVGVAGVVKHARRGDQEIERRLVTGGGLDPPGLPLEAGVDDLAVEPDVRAQAVTVGDRVEVAPISAPGENRCVQSGLGSNEYWSKRDGTSHASPG
jgi:hypothetical protein